MWWTKMKSKDLLRRSFRMRLTRDCLDINRTNFRQTDIPEAATNFTVTPSTSQLLASIDRHNS
jgi:hypothetical protein